MSPFFRSLELELDWIVPPIAVAHPLDDGCAVVARRSLEEIGQMMGITRERVRQIEADALRRLAEWREFEGLRHSA